MLTCTTACRGNTAQDASQTPSARSRQISNTIHANHLSSGVQNASQTGRHMSPSGAADAGTTTSTRCVSPAAKHGCQKSEASCGLAGHCPGLRAQLGSTQVSCLPSALHTCKAQLRGHLCLPVNLSACQSVYM